MWRPYLRRRIWPPAQLRLMALTGVLLGLLAYQAMRLVPAPGHVALITQPIEAVDPYDEARRSRAILESQEGAPTQAIGEQDGSAQVSAPTGRPDVSNIPGPVRVIDGDTFDYGGVRVRVADIDTPEVHGRCASETELAARATQRMRALLAAGPFELRPLASGRDEDRYGRKLRIVTRGGRSLGDQLVAEGLARTWSGRREPWCV